MNLANRLNVGCLPVFDYAALGDDQIEKRALAAVLRIRELQKAALVDIGHELLAMKELLPHGQFLPWVESIGISRRSANDYMHVAAEFGSKWATVAHLPHGVIYKLAAPSTPPAVREAVMKIRSDQVVSVGTVQNLIETLKDSDARKRRSEIRKQQRADYDQNIAAQRARMESRYAKEKAERAAAVSKARDAAEQVRFMLGKQFDDACRLLSDIDLHLFLEEFRRFVGDWRNREMLKHSRVS